MLLSSYSYPSEKLKLDMDVSYSRPSTKIMRHVDRHRELTTNTGNVTTMTSSQQLLLRDIRYCSQLCAHSAILHDVDIPMLTECIEHVW